MPCVRTNFGSGSAIITLGGAIFRISVGGKIHTFEDHSWCGPVKLKPNGDPAKGQPNDFLEAASLWYQHGKKVDAEGLCIWFHEPVPITKHMGGRHYKVIGWHPPVQGS